MSEKNISKEEVKKIADLSELDIKEGELEDFTGHLADILEHASDIESLQLSDVPPTTHPYPLKNVMREDEVQPVLDKEEVLKSAPEAEDGQFRVPPIMKDEG